jgi:thioredoxin 1
VSKIDEFVEDFGMSLLTSVATAEFGREVLFSPTPVVVDFSADRCGPCRVLAPVLERLANRYSGKVRFLKADVDADPELAEHYGVSTIPTLLLFQHGQLLERYEGLSELKSLVAKLDRLADFALSDAR